MSGRDKPAKAPRLRRLSDEEIELWRQVAITVVRRPGTNLPDVETRPVEAPVPMPPSDKTPPKLPKHQPPKHQPPKHQPYAAPYTPSPQVAVPKMAPLERKLKQRLARGRIGADAAIDLHGFRAAEALSVLRHFLFQAQAEGARVVLVVTGKGGRGVGDPFDMTGGGTGVLKRSVPMWLAQPDLRAIVVGFEEAGRPHGGAGALYVRLRRRG